MNLTTTTKLHFKELLIYFLNEPSHMTMRSWTASQFGALFFYNLNVSETHLYRERTGGYQRGGAGGSDKRGERNGEAQLLAVRWVSPQTQCTHKEYSQ